MRKTPYIKAFCAIAIAVTFCSLFLFEAKASDVKEYATDEVAVFYEENTTLSPSQLLSNELQPTTHTNELGFLPHPIWAKVVYESPVDTQVIFHLDYTHIDSIWLYHYHDKILNSQFVTGDRFPHYERPVYSSTFAFPIQVKKGSNTFLLRMSTGSSYKFPIRITSEKSFRKRDTIRTFWFGLYYGLAFIMVVYHLFVFGFTLDKATLWFVIHLAGTSTTMIFHNSVGLQFLWPEAIFWDENLLIFSGGITILGNLYFAYYFLNMKKHSKACSIAIHIAAIMAIGFVLIAYLLPYAVLIRPFMAYTMAIAVLSWSAGLYVFRKGFGPAKYFVLGWSVYFIGIMITIVNSTFVLMHNLDSIQIIQASSALTIIAMSWALSNRIQFLQNQIVQTQVEKESFEKHILKVHAERLESEVKNRTEELESLNKQKSTFLAVVSHDLRNMITSLDGIGAIAQEYVKSKRFEKFDFITSMLDASTQRLNLFLENVLTWSMKDIHRSKIEPETIDVNNTLKDVVDLLQPIARIMSVRIEMSISPNLAVRCDHHAFQLILRNLIGNAIKYTEADRAIHITATKADQQTKISVKNPGTGMSEQKIRALTSQEIATSENGLKSQSGKGLGLYLVFQAVEENHGNIEVISHDNGDIEFLLTLSES